jgi:signal transduction histidine kinase
MDELYPFNFTDAYGFIEFNNNLSVIQVELKDSKKKFPEMITNLEEILTRESYINVGSMILKMDKFLVLKIEFKRLDDEIEIFYGIIIKNINNNYLLILLPNEDVLQKISENLEKDMEEKKDYSDEVFHDIKDLLSTITINCNELGKLKDINSIDEYGLLKEHINTLNTLVNNLCYFVEIDKQYSYKNNCKWNEILFQSILQSTAIWKQYSKESLIFTITYNDVIIYQGHPGKLYTTHLAKILDSIYCNEQLMIRAIRNIIENSIKYTRAKEEPRILISVYDNKSPYILKIWDNGIGIRKNDINKVKQRGFRANVAFVRETPGSGLGLSIAEKVFKQYQLTLLIYSEVDRYTEMKLMK